MLSAGESIMKYKNIALIALSAALLLSGCNTDKAVTTTDTSAVTEEVTTTEATTTAAPVTTVISETVSEKPPKLPEEKPFEVQELEISHVEPAPDVGSETNRYVIADEKAYYMLNKGPEALHSDYFMIFAEHIGLYDEIKTDFADYLDKNRLMTEKIAELPEVLTYLGLFGTEPYDDGKWHFFGEKWLMQLHDGVFSELFMYDERGTKLREITELLRKEYEQFPHLSIIAVTETSNDAESFNDLTLELIDMDSEEMEGVKQYLSKNGADISLCSFNKLWEKQNEIPVYSFREYDKHYIALNGGVYLQATVPGMNEQETIRCIRVQCGDALADEAEKRGLGTITAERENIGYYGYNSLFDIVPVRDPDTRCVMLDDNVLLATSDSEYALYTYDKEMTAFRDTITTLRRYHMIHDIRYDFHIEALEFDYNSDSDSCFVTIIAPKEQWENIRDFVERDGKHIGIKPDLLKYSEKLTKDYIDGIHRR